MHHVSLTISLSYTFDFFICLIRCIFPILKTNGMKVIWCFVPGSAEWSPAMLSPPIRSGPAGVSGTATQGLSHEVSENNLSCLPKQHSELGPSWAPVGPSWGPPWPNRGPYGMLLGLMMDRIIFWQSHCVILIIS